MSVNDTMDALVDAAASAGPDKPIARSGVTLRHGSEVEFSNLVAEDLEATYDFIFTQDNFWRYDTEKGIWLVRDDHLMRNWIAQYDGMKVFWRKKPDGETQTTPLKIGDRFMKGTTAILKSRWHDLTFFNKAPPGLAFKNCFVTLDGRRNIVTVPHDPNNRARFALPYGFEEGDCPRFRAFLQDIWGGDTDCAHKIQFLRAFIGSCMLGCVTTYDKVCVFVGEGSNGKSVLFDFLRSLFPKENLTAVEPQKWKDPYFAAHLNNSQINMVAELPAAELVDTSNFKKIVTGDITNARSPYGLPFDFNPRAGHLFSINPPYPAVADFSHGFWRRFTILTFNRTFTDADKVNRELLLSSLREEAQYIAHWCIEGARDALVKGVLPSVETSGSALADWRQSTDNVARFIKDACVENPEKMRTDLFTLFRSYTKWHERVGLRNKCSQFSFRDRLRTNGFPPDAKNSYELIVHERYSGEHRFGDARAAAAADDGDDF